MYFEYVHSSAATKDNSGF